MNTPGSGDGAFQLPSEILEICDLAKRIVQNELMPLEQEFLPHPGHAFGIKETTNLRRVFGDEGESKRRTGSGAPGLGW